MGKYLVFASIGFELVGLIVGSYYIGQALDKKYQTQGLIFVGLAVLSLIAWLVRVVWLLKRLEKQDDATDTATEVEEADAAKRSGKPQ